MNIAIDTRCLQDKKLTGVGQYTKEILTELSRTESEHRFFLFCNSWRETQLPDLNKEKFTLVKFNWPNKLLNLSIGLFKYPKIDRLINKKINATIDLFFFPNINYVSCHCPYIITAHDLSFDIYPEFYSLRLKLWHWLAKPKKLFTQAKQIIAVSNNTRQDLIEHYKINPEKVITIYSGVSTRFTSETIGESQRLALIKKYSLPNKFFLFLGTIEQRKNIDSLITAFQMFNQKHPEYRLVLAGKPGFGFKQIKRKISSPNILLLNYIDDEDKPNLYRLAQAFIFPSYYEGFGLPILEAMACGTPVITSSNSSLSEIAGNSALLINPHNINSLVTGMENIIKPSTHEYYSKQGLEYSKQFNWQKSVDELIKLFK